MGKIYKYVDMNIF